MIRKNHFLIFLAAICSFFQAYSQGERKDKAAVTYEEIYDEPYSVNKLFVQIQPMYGELFATNVNAGFGGELTYYHEDKADFHASFRKTFGQQFYDLNRDLAERTSDLDNRSQVFNYFEIGSTYHVKDFEQSSKTKMFLFKNSYKGNKWASRVPLHAEVPCKVRKVYGARLGTLLWKSTTNLTPVLEKQKLAYSQFVSISDETKTLQDAASGKKLDLFTNMTSMSIYVGGSMSWIKNVAVNFDKFEEGIDDLMLTVYADILYAPVMKMDNLVYTQDKGTPTAVTQTYDVSPLKTSTFGFRMGIDGKFNRTWGWGYGGEFGYRPSLQGRSFYAMLKISFPVFGTNLDYKVESFGK